jgi:hypothetical protein
VLEAAGSTACLQAAHRRRACCRGDAGTRAGPSERQHLLTASHVAHSLAPRIVPAGAVHALYCKAGAPVQAADMRAAAHYAPFAMAAYGALYYVYLDPKVSHRV